MTSACSSSLTRYHLWYNCLFSILVLMFYIEEQFSSIFRKNRELLKICPWKARNSSSYSFSTVIVILCLFLRRTLVKLIFSAFRCVFRFQRSSKLLRNSSKEIPYNSLKTEVFSRYRIRILSGWLNFSKNVTQISLSVQNVKKIE